MIWKHLLISLHRPPFSFFFNSLISLYFSRGSFAGSIFLTNYRMVFVPSKPTPTITAIEIPLLFISNEKMSQPIFGANNLSGLVTPVDAPPNSSERITWKLSFTNGGMGTLVPLFYATLEYLRVSSRRRHQEAPPPPEFEQQQPVQPDAPKQEPPSFIQTALLDPNDPTKVYLTSPVDPAQAHPEKYPVV